MYTHKNSPGSNTELPHNYLQFLRLDPETLSRSLHQTTEKNTICFNSANHMTNRWHFEITVTQAEDLERNCIKTSVS